MTFSGTVSDISVCTYPGVTQLTVMPRGLFSDVPARCSGNSASRARVRVRPNRSDVPAA
jgi:hypothetical protein